MDYVSNGIRTSGDYDQEFLQYKK